MTTYSYHAPRGPQHSTRSLLISLVVVMAAFAVVLALTGCTLTFEADGSKSVILDGESLIQILADK